MLTGVDVRAVVRAYEAGRNRVRALRAAGRLAGGLLDGGAFAEGGNICNLFAAEDGARAGDEWTAYRAGAEDEACASSP